MEYSGYAWYKFIFQLYSGYYQHEVKANLVEAEKMFEAMGYTLLPNQTLILEGPICPDQVTNVSRDSMTAYVECQVFNWRVLSNNGYDLMN